jgi:hypothetical protein
MSGPILGDLSNIGDRGYKKLATKPFIKQYENKKGKNRGHFDNKNKQLGPVQVDELIATLMFTRVAVLIQLALQPRLPYIRS